MSKPRKTWDKGVDFDTALAKIMELRGYAKSLKKPRMLRTLNIALIQLTNGLRVSEAIECYQKFLESNGNEREIIVRIRKSKDRYRLCIVPPAIDKTDVALTKGLKPPSVSTIKSMIPRYLGANTHSLRYAFINKLLKQGIDIATISKIVGHTRLDTLLTYVQMKRAREVLEEVVRASSPGAPKQKKKG